MKRASHSLIYYIRSSFQTQKAQCFYSTESLIGSFALIYATIILAAISSLLHYATLLYCEDIGN